MAKTSGEIEKEFIESLKQTTGLELKQWLAEINKSGLTKRNDIIGWLKTKKSFGHMNASLLAGIYINNGKPVYGNEKELLDNQFEKYPAMRPLFDSLQQSILNWDSSSEFIAKKTYVSVTKKREFAAINIKKGELRLGMDLGEMPFDGKVERAKLTGPMPRISHMVVIKSETDIDKNIFKLLEQSNKRVNG